MYVCTCTFFDCQADFDVDDVERRELVNFYGYTDKSYYYYYSSSFSSSSSSSSSTRYKKLMLAATDKPVVYFVGQSICLTDIDFANLFFSLPSPPLLLSKKERIFTYIFKLKLEDRSQIVAFRVLV